MPRFVQGLAVLALLTGLSAAPSARLTGALPFLHNEQVALAASSAFALTQDPATTAIQDVIQRSNAQQIQAIATKDPSVMVDTVSSAHYDELVGINQDLLDNGVSSIRLVNLEWGAVTITGDTATATTYETWTTVFADGSTMRSRDRNDYSLVLDNGAWKITADGHPGPGPTGLTAPPSTSPVPGATGPSDTSNNWSGYAATGGTFTSVNGTWSIPQFNPSESSFGVDAAWVGIGGVSSRDLIQAGTQETIAGSGRTEYQAWIETLPQASRTVPLTVHPGDSVSVSIDETGADTWRVKFVNNTTAQSYDETVRYRSSHSSAEWVEEAPSGSRGGVLPLSNFGKIDFSNGLAVKNGQTISIAEAGASPITMINGNHQALAVPSALGTDGSTFTVARTDASSDLATAPRGRLPRVRVPLPVVPQLPTLPAN
ncbi:MAG: hypothetical protein NVSMB2_09260 [Chloroflexota bacterium]